MAVLAIALPGSVALNAIVFFEVIEPILGSLISIRVYETTLSQPEGSPFSEPDDVFSSAD